MGEIMINRRKRIKTLSLAILIFLLSVSWAQAKVEITVSAAASLSGVMRVIKSKFEESNPDIAVMCNFASSGSLLQQIRYGAPVDVFASANEVFMDEAVHRGLVLEKTRIAFAGNHLVLASPANKHDIGSGPAILTGESARVIAIGSPSSVPAGKYAVESLESCGLWNQISHKVVWANSVRQVLDYIMREEVDYGIVYATDLLAGGGKVKPVCPLGGHSPVVYPAAVVKDSERVAESVRFLDFLLSPGGRAILKRFGFTVPEAKG